VKNYYVINILGPDRSGIVDEVSAIITASGCNIADSHMAVLGLEFGLMILISGAPAGLETAISGVSTWAGDNAMTCISKVTNLPSLEKKSGAIIDLEIPDSPGIVSRVSHFLAEKGANVESIDTDIQPAPFSGTPTFSMHVNFSAEQNISLADLRKALSDLADKEDIHLTVGQSI
jgi:glycine cleavage system transcriptional repressor